jgi:hypothetical protein
MTIRIIIVTRMILRNIITVIGIVASVVYYGYTCYHSDRYCDLRRFPERLMGVVTQKGGIMNEVSGLFERRMVWAFVLCWGRNAQVEINFPP